MRYVHLDVFTGTPLAGNQLAVFPEPPLDLAPARMQAIAAEMAFSETTFLFPPAAGGDVRMRIFTPGEELPMAGHPTIGATFALAGDGRLRPGDQGLTFELGVGPIPVSLEWEGSALRFAWMTQLLPTFGPEITDRGAAAAALGVEGRDLMDLPVEVVSCGVPFLFLPLRSRGAVDRAVLDRRALASVYAAAGLDELPVFLFTLDRTGARGEETVYSRMLAPGFGISEDPATGGASGPLGCFLFHHGAVDGTGARNLLSLQGAAMGRPSHIHIAIDTIGDMISRVRIGGSAVRVAEGRLLV